MTIYYCLYTHLTNEFDYQSYLSGIYTTKDEAEEALIKQQSSIDKNDPDEQRVYVSIETWQNTH